MRHILALRGVLVVAYCGLCFLIVCPRLSTFICYLWEIETHDFFMQVFWKIDSMENSLRMRKRLRRNYKATGNHVASADHKDSQHFVDMSAGIPLPAEVAKLASVDVRSEETREEDIGSKQDDKEETKKHNSVEEDLGTATEAEGTPGSALKQSTNAGAVLAAASLQAEPKEIMLLEIAGALVQPGKVRGGMFQVFASK